MTEGICCCDTQSRYTDRVAVCVGSEVAGLRGRADLRASREHHSRTVTRDSGDHRILQDGALIA